MYARYAPSRIDSRWTLFALVLAGLAGASTGAVAQPPAGPPGPPSISVMDTNGDGKVSADEFAQFRAQRMAARASEGRLMRNAGNAPTFESIDANGDGYLTQAELVQTRQGRFAAGGGRGRGYGGGPGNGPGPAGRPCVASP